MDKHIGTVDFVCKLFVTFLFHNRHIFLGAALEEQWNSIKRKCVYAFKQDKTTYQD